MDLNGKERIVGGGKARIRINYMKKYASKENKNSKKTEIYFITRFISYFNFCIKKNTL